jgi:hypothetical protein
MGQLLVPAMIGGGIGALGGAVSGNNPFKSALLGAGLGAGGAGLMGAAGGAGAATAAGGADLAAGTVAPALLGTPTLNASLLTPSAVAGLGATPSVYGGLGASSLLDKTGAFLSNNIGNPFTDLTSRDKLGLGLQGASMLSQPQQMIQPSQGQISRPQFDPSSTLVNVAPNVNPQDKPLTEEELLRLQQMLQTTGFRGR